MQAADQAAANGRATNSMSDSTFVDTNVLVYAVDDSEPEKRDLARRSLGSKGYGKLVVSAQILSEFYVTVTRKLAEPEWLPAAAQRGPERRPADRLGPRGEPLSARFRGACSVRPGTNSPAPIQRHPLASLLTGAWARRENQRLVDALYSELAAALDSIPLLTTDARLARADDHAEVVT